MKQYTTIDEYIENFPLEVKRILYTIKTLIHTLAPLAHESISYGIPTFTQKEHLIHFAAYKNHIGIYPTSSGIREFTKKYSRYVKGKGTIQLPLSEPIPYDLIEKIVRFRLSEITSKHKTSH